MKIQQFHNEFDVINTEFESNETTIYVDIKFSKDKKIYHLVEQDIWPNELEPGELGVRYDYVSFRVDSSNLKPTDITRALITFLGRYKLYLYRYNIISNGAFVSYASPKSEVERFADLKYSPKRQNQVLFLSADVQLEDDVDYEKLLDIRMKNPVDAVSFEELEELGYKIGEAGIQNFAILSDEDVKNRLPSSM